MLGAVCDQAPHIQSLASLNQASQELTSLGESESIDFYAFVCLKVPEMFVVSNVGADFLDVFGEVA